MPARSPDAVAEPTFDAPGVSWHRLSLLWPPAIISVLILALGVIECLYGNTDSGDVYGSDAVQYLDLARAFARHDWRSVLNPLWSQGYPALLALLRPLFAVGPGGDWWLTRVSNLLVFSASYAAFLYLLFALLPVPRSQRREERNAWLRRALPCLLLFAAGQVCLGQVSRVNPDELVTAFFLLACGQLARLHRRVVLGRNLNWPSALGLGLTLALGFLVKAVFLALGTGILGIATVVIWRERSRLAPLLASFAVFTAVVAGYGAALSHAVGYPTVGEAGSINYAWHVDRLQKWVHWEGGVQPAAEAWPKPSIARFAQWDGHPPDFGNPVHPSAVVQTSPTVYSFAAPVHATYVPYFDAPYFYQGYRHVYRLRYQVIALIKSVGDLLQVLFKQPIAWGLLLALAVMLRSAPVRTSFLAGLRLRWPLLEASVLGFLFYLPVHLEGRYLTGMLLVLGTCALLAVPPAALQASRAAALLFLLGFAAEIAVYQLPVWRNLLHGRSPSGNVEWQMGRAASEQHLPPDAPVGVIAWTPNLHSDWAYIAHLQITSEIASGPDYDQFWHLPAAGQAATLATFRRTGAVAVLVNGKPAGLGGPEWHQLGGTPLWMARLR